MHPRSAEALAIRWFSSLTPRVDADISGTILSLNAAVTPAGDIVLHYGLATGLPAGATLVGTGETTVPVQYLPANCRP